ncbi:hypothetical protein [Niveibacterium sp. SC-1]|uniref:hypothetical protein n=1 Tax=Niveibacterium sp. SC-1 TaxID=3135646 RepID=UPI00311F8498
MALSYRLPRTRRLTHGGFVLARQRRLLPLLWGALTGVVVAALAISAYVLFAPEAESVRQLAEVRRAHAKLAQEADENRLAARMASARASELERQINTLNENLRQAQDELAFFRKTQDSKR